jgi:hypothetical protein
MAKPILPLPGSNANETGAPSPWDPKEIPEPDYPGAPKNTDPRTLFEGTPVDNVEIPGSRPPNEPWRSAPAPTPRRLRRDA